MTVLHPSRTVALATCAELPDLDPDDRLLLAALERAGVEVAPAVWDDPTVDWSSFDLVVLRNTWDYAVRRDEFVAWARRVPRLANAAEVVAWNTDKRYLAELGTAGIDVVPTRWVEPGEAFPLPCEGEWVVKPAVSAGSRDTGRYDCGDPGLRALAAAHVGRLQAAGRLVMVQPYLASVDTYGETALMFFGGEYSHAVRKGPMLQGPDPGVEVLYLQEQITPRSPSQAERDLAEATLRALPFAPQSLLYARVDLLHASSGPVVIELELTEPSLFFGAVAGAVERFVAAVSKAAGSRST